MKRTEQLQAMLDRGEGFESYAWPGGYPIRYYTADGGELCGRCANDNGHLTNDPGMGDWYVWGFDILEGDETDHPDATCDHCGRNILEDN